MKKKFSILALCLCGLFRGYTCLFLRLFCPLACFLSLFLCGGLFCGHTFCLYALGFDTGVFCLYACIFNLNALCFGFCGLFFLGNPFNFRIQKCNQELNFLILGICWRKFLIADVIFTAVGIPTKLEP